MANKDAVLKFLTYLGLDFAESQVFLFLSENSEETILNVSKKTKVPRTTVYRIIERLRDIGLLEEVEYKSKKLYKTVGMHKIDILVKEKESEVGYLKKLLPELQDVFTNQNVIANDAFKVSSFEGKRAVIAMLQNLYRANNEIYRFVHFDLSSIIGDSYKTWVLELIRSGVPILELHNNESEKTITELEKRSIFRSVSVSPKRYQFMYEQWVYDDTVFKIFLKNGDYYGLEIKDATVAKSAVKLANLLVL